jgi:hypothetical protein
VFAGTDVVCFVIKRSNNRCFGVDGDGDVERKDAVFVCPRHFDVSGDGVIAAFCPFERLAGLRFDEEM